MGSELEDDDAAVEAPDEVAALVEHVTQLRDALEGRDVIGQAKGILMERHRFTADEAFARLVRVSQDRNLKVRELAARLAETGTLEP